MSQITFVRVKILSPELQAVVLRLTMSNGHLWAKEILSPTGDWLPFQEGDTYRNHMLSDTWLPANLEWRPTL